MVSFFGALEGILPALTCSQEHFGDARVGIDGRHPFERVFRYDDVVVAPTRYEIEFSSIRLADLYQDPVYPAPGFRSFAVPDRLALLCFRADHCAGPLRSKVRLQFDPALETVDDTFHIGIAHSCGVLQSTEVRDVSASP